jgi:hypothetical protein
MKRAAGAVLACVSALGVFNAQTRSGACTPPTWSPAGRVQRVSSARALEDAVRGARPHETILIADGQYRLSAPLEISVSQVTLRGESGDRDSVVLRGGGMTGDSVGVAIGVNAPDVTIADLTVRDVGFHAVQVRGEQGASRFTLRNAHLMDTGQQLLKGSLSAKPVFADQGLVACSEFSYTDHAPSDYTNGVDVLGGKGWTIRDNRFLRIRGPREMGWSAGPTILMWAASEDTVVERNVIIDSFRGIAFGMRPGLASYARNGERSYDHRGGIIRNNIIVNLNGWADEAIEANGAQNARIEHNSVLVEGSAGWSIGVRFPSASALVRNNLSNRQVLSRNGGRVTAAGNVLALPEWFVDPAGANLQITPAARSKVRVDVHIPDSASDFDGRPRATERPVDAGAYQSGEVTGP